MASFTNQAQLELCDTIIQSNIVTGQIVDSLALTKTATLDQYSTDTTLTYVLTVINNSTATVGNITITDTPWGHGADGRGHGISQKHGTPPSFFGATKNCEHTVCMLAAFLFILVFIFQYAIDRSVGRKARRLDLPILCCAHNGAVRLALSNVRAVAVPTSGNPSGHL